MEKNCQIVQIVVTVYHCVIFICKQLEQDSFGTAPIDDIVSAPEKVKVVEQTFGIVFTPHQQLARRGRTHIYTSAIPARHELR
jgi:hypothetical protein